MMEENEVKENQSDFESSKGGNKKFINKADLMDKARQNPWMISTIVLGLLFIVFLFGGASFTGNTISSKTVGDNFESFALAKGIDVSVNNVEVVDGLYEVSFSSEEMGDSSVFITLDGKNLINGLIPLESLESPESDSVSQDIPKSDKPVVELFVWGYCPYGVQAQGPLAEVASLLGDYADFNTVLYYDGHGEFETEQNKIQECIQKIAPEKYWAYASGFVSDIYPKCSSSRTVECDKTESVNLMKSLGIDSDEILNCVDTEGDKLIADASTNAKDLGVTGSPTLVINGVKANPSSRTAEAFKTLICESFNDAPEACTSVLSDNAAAASGNC